MIFTYLQYCVSGVRSTRAPRTLNGTKPVQEWLVYQSCVLQNKKECCILSEIYPLGNEF